MKKTDRDIWVEDTQMYQRIAKVQESSKEELEREWEKMKAPKKRKKDETAKS